MTSEDVRSADQILARLVAAAYAADHPEHFGKEMEGNLEEEDKSYSLQSSNPDLDTATLGAYPSGRRDHQLVQTTDGPSPDSLTRRPNGYTYS